MSFREKSDWVSFVLLCIFGVFFAEIARIVFFDATPRSGYYFFIFFWLLVGALILVRVATHFYLAKRSPKDAKMPHDERERQIELLALRPAYFLLLLGSFLVMGTLHLRFNTWQFAHCIFF